MSNTCPVCETQLKEVVERPGGRDVTFFSCPLCGDFTLSRSLIRTLPHFLQGNKDASAKISHAIRKMQQVNKGVELYTTTVKEIIKRPLPSLSEQADLFVRWLAENVKDPGETVWVAPETHRSIIGAKTPKGFSLVLNDLFDAGLVTGNLSTARGALGQANATLSVKGWNYCEQLRQRGVLYRKAFMAMKFGDPVLDNVLEHVFKPCVRQAGFELYNLGDVPRAGLIDDKLRVEIRASDFLVADLTHDNPGSYWEAGYAAGLGKPVIYTCEKEKFEKEKTHFDTNHQLTVVWDKNSPAEAGVRLKATIRTTLPEIAKQEDE